MDKDAFKPKLGRVGDAGRGRGVRYATRVATERARNTLRRKGHIDPNANRRGLATGVIAAGGSFVPGTRRVVVRARYVRQVKGDLGAARAHLRYILRDGTTREGAPGHLYDAHCEVTGAEAFLERSDGDPHQFRFIVSIEDSARIADLKPVIRDLMRAMETDLGTVLDWVAVDHFNTGHPHTHVVVRGRDMEGRDLVMARDYIAFGIRARAEDLVTLELGPETELERIAKRANEIGQERLTRLDRTLMRRSIDTVVTLAASDRQDATKHTQLVARLRKLESLGLAAERRAGVWSLDPDLEIKLRRLGVRADKIKMMQRALAELGMERAPGTLAVFDRGNRKAPLIGKVVGTGFIDEISDRSWIIVDGADGRVHYVELGRLKPEAIPARQAIIRIIADRPTGKPQATPRLELLSRGATLNQASYDGPLWIDRIVADGLPDTQRYRGFGAEMTQMIEARQAWLARQDLGRFRDDGRFELRHSAVTELRRREIARVGRQLEQQTGLRHVTVAQGATVRGTVGRAIDTPDGRYLAITSGREVRLVPWSKPLERYLGREVTGTMGIKQLLVGRQRGRNGPER